MKIVCLVKQVPHPEAIEFDEETKALKREGVPLELNPFDRTAVREAVRLRERHGGEVVVMTMGPPQAETALRETLALGADRCIHLSDRLFALADTIGTSRTLALALRKEGADLILFGRKTVDSETWQVPPEVAAFLGLPQLTNVSELEIDGDRVRGRRETDEGETVYELGLPAVVSLARADDGAVEPASDGTIDVWTAADLVGDPRENDKRFGQTGSPTRVLAVRDVTPERAGQRLDDPGQAAERVAELVQERLIPPASWEKPPHLAEQPGASYDCWTVVELVDGRPHRISLELLGKGRELAGKLGGANVALLLGHGLERAVREVARHGAEVVHVADDPALAEYHTDAWAAVIGSVLERRRPHILLIPATPAGRDYGPRVAGKLELGMTGDCVGLDIAKAGRLLQRKPAYGGNIVSTIMGATTPQLATVRARMFRPVEPRDGVEAEVHRIALDDAALRPGARLVEENRSPELASYPLDEAEIVVLVGRDAGSEAVAAASALEGAAAAGTRQLCAAGVLPWTRHVGLYGRPVAPSLLIAVEVPGDFEQLTGFVKAGVVVALAASEGSPMLEAADVAVVGDWRRTLPQVHEAVAARLGEVR